MLAMVWMGIVGKKHWLARATACTITISQTPMGLGKRQNRARVAHATVAICWHSSLGNTLMGLCMACTVQVIIIMLCIACRKAFKVPMNMKLCMVGRKHYLATTNWQIAPKWLGTMLYRIGKLHGLASKLEVGIMLHIAGRKHRLASKCNLRLYMVGRKHWLATPKWHKAPMVLGIAGKKHGLASKMHLNIRL